MKPEPRFLCLFLSTLLLCAAVTGATPEGSRARVVEALEIARVPAGFPVQFCLLTAPPRQYVAYFDEERRMTVASRALGSDKWDYKVLPSKIGWDSHNYITMALDREGQLHVSGNMHGDPLVYFRTEEPGDIATLKQFAMTGERENRATYPVFLEDHEGDLVFLYRDGGSGNGVRIFNKYDADTGSWARLLDNPIFDGQGARNAYPLGPVRGPDGLFHVVWVWRDTPDCATNHHLSYVRSKDLLHWESVFGKPVALPITIGEESLLVDPIPSGGGIINGCQKLFFDENNRPVISYHKSDENGNMQIYAARTEGKEWVRHVLTGWEMPVEFSGRGSMGFIGISISGMERIKPGLLTMTYRHRDYGSGRLFIDEASLSPASERVDVPRVYPEELDKLKSDFEGMGIRRATDIGDPGSENDRYILQWETLGRNFDRPRKPPLPEPSTLTLYKLVSNE